jgi:endonuclease-3
MPSLEKVLATLQQFYGTLPPPPRQAFALFVWEVLSSRAVPQKRDAAMAALKRIPALTPDAMARAPQKQLQESVALAGPYSEQRLSALRTGVDVFRRTPTLPAIIRGPLATARRALKGLPQMGEGGAYRMLLFAADHAVLPVDARINRVALRLGYGVSPGAFARTARSVRDALEKELPCSVEAYQRAFLYLSQHGAATCTESDPHCTVCPLARGCPEGMKRLQMSALRPNSAKPPAGEAS